MLEIKKLHANGIELDAAGLITRSDYRRVRPVAAAIIEKQGSYSALVDITSARGFSLGAIWEDMKFDLRYFRKTKRIAFIAHRPVAWLWLSSLPFATGGVRFFTPPRREDGRAWAFKQP